MSLNSLLMMMLKNDGLVVNPEWAELKKRVEPVGSKIVFIWCLGVMGDWLWCNMQYDG